MAARTTKGCTNGLAAAVARGSSGGAADTSKKGGRGDPSPLFLQNKSRHACPPPGPRRTARQPQRGQAWLAHRRDASLPRGSPFPGGEDEGAGETRLGSRASAALRFGTERPSGSRGGGGSKGRQPATGCDAAGGGIGPAAACATRRDAACVPSRRASPGTTPPIPPPGRPIPQSAIRCRGGRARPTASARRSRPHRSDR